MNLDEFRSIYMPYPISKETIAFRSPFGFSAFWAFKWPRPCVPAHVGAVKMVKMGSLLGTTRGWRMITTKKCMFYEFLLVNGDFIQEK